VLRQSPNAFRRTPVTAYHDPILTTDDVQLLETFNWESPK
jgi:hypothetical protein